MLKDNYLIYQSHGITDIYNEVLFSYLSFCKHNDQKLAKVIIYTDNKEYFENTFTAKNLFEIRLFDKKKLNTWAGKHNFVHRIKLEALLDATANIKGNILYLDSDTYISGSLEEYFNKIENNQLIMHRREAFFASHKGRQIPRFRKNLSKNRAKHTITDFNFEYWNAGVIGFNTDNKQLIENALKLTDAVYDFNPVFTVEQLAISYNFSKHSKIIPIEDSIYHYWNFKDFRAVLKLFFEKYHGLSLDAFMHKMEHINPIEFHKPKLKWEKQHSIYRRIRKLLTGKTWEMPDYARLMKN